MTAPRPFGDDPGTETFVVTLNDQIVDPTTLPGYAATGPAISREQALAAGGQWTIRDDGLIENLVAGEQLTHPAPAGLCTWVGDALRQQLGAPDPAHAALSPAQIQAKAASEHATEGAADPAPAPAPVSAAPAATPAHPLDGAAPGTVINADHPDLPPETTLEKTGAGEIKLVAPVPAVHQAAHGSTFMAIERDVAAVIAKAKAWWALHILHERAASAKS